MTQQAAPHTEVEGAPPRAIPREELAPSAQSSRRGVRRARAARLALLFGVAASLTAGGWGVFSSLGVEPEPARIGEAVEVPEGLVRVDGVTPEHMVPMQADKFAAGGMNMSAMGMDMAPEGQRRFTVGVALAAEDDALNLSPESFRLTGEGTEEAGPIRDTLKGETLPEGSAVSGSLVFQVPEDAEGLELSFDGSRPVALDLPPLPEGEDHRHGAPAGGAQEEEHGGSDEGEHEH